MIKIEENKADMQQLVEPLTRIADALEAMVPAPQPETDWSASPAYVWNERGVVALDELRALPASLLGGIDSQKVILLENTRRHALSLPAHDALLWGARGMGKSELVKACCAMQQQERRDLALVQICAADQDFSGLPGLMQHLAGIQRRFILYIDDIGFDASASDMARQLRSWLEGGAMARPDNIRLYVTSNRRHIIERHMSEQDDPINPRDVRDDRLALADRFGLSLGFHNCDQACYLAIIAGYAAHFDLAFDEGDALQWARQRSQFSGRIAWHYIVELAGRSGRRLD